MSNSIVDLFNKTARDELNITGSPEIANVEVVFSESPLDQDDVELFVGRITEIKEFSVSLMQATKGLYQKIFLVGKNGIGKSTILNIAESAATKEEQLKLIPVVIYKKHYEGDLETIRFTILNEIMHVLIHKIYPRADWTKEKEVMQGLASCLVKGALRLPDSDLAIREAFLEGGLIKQDEDPVIEYSKKLVDKRLLLLFDEAYYLVDTPSLFNEVISLIEKLNAIATFAVLPSHIEELKKTNSEVLKDAKILELAPLNEKELQELLRKRLVLAKDGSSGLKRTPNYIDDLQPFTLPAVENIARKSNGMPLKFIQLLKEAFIIATNERTPIIDEKIVEKIKEDETLIKLTTTQQIVLTYIREKGSVTINDIKELRKNKTKVAAFYILDELFNKQLIEKKREGKEVKYFIKK